MRNLVLCALVGLTALMIIPTNAAAKNCGRCGHIKSSDDRNMCRAKCEGKSVYCGHIKNADKRHYCRAVVERKPVVCGHIKNAKMRRACRAEAGK